MFLCVLERPRVVLGGWCSALALLVAQVLADHHDPSVTTDHLALVADLLDARLDLHRPAVCSWWSVGLWCGRAGSCGFELGGAGGASAVPEDDPATRQVVRAEFDDHPVLGEDPDVVLAHLA